MSANMAHLGILGDLVVGVASLPPQRDLLNVLRGVARCVVILKEFSIRLEDEDEDIPSDLTNIMRHLVHLFINNYAVMSIAEPKLWGALVVVHGRHLVDIDSALIVELMEQAVTPPLRV